MLIQDFISVVVRSKGVALKLAENFQSVVTRLVRSTRLYEGLSQLHDSLRQHAVMYYLDTLWQQVAETNSSNRSFASANGTEIEMMRRFLREHKRQVALFHVYMSEPFAVQNFHVDGVPDKGANAFVLASTNRRRLLQEETTLSRVVDSYSSLVASTKGFSNISSNEMYRKTVDFRNAKGS
jgi:hypothetical protein